MVLAAATDWVDGYRGAQIQPSDPRLALSLTLLPTNSLLLRPSLCCSKHSRNPLVCDCPLMVIIGREIVISALREWMAAARLISGTVAVAMVGKVKTWVQMVRYRSATGGRADLKINCSLTLGFVAIYFAAALDPLVDAALSAAPPGRISAPRATGALGQHH